MAKAPKKKPFSQPPARDSKFRSGQSPARNLPPPGITSRKDSSPSGRNNVSEGSYTPSERPLNKRRKNNPYWERSRGAKARSSFGPEWSVCLRPPVIGAEAESGPCPLRSGQEGLKS